MKSSTRKIQETHLARPSPGEGWEIWTAPPGTPRLIRQALDLQVPEAKTLRIIGLPVLYLPGFSRWLQTADETLLPGMVQTLIERNGLLPRAQGGQLLSWTPLICEETRTLVLIRILAGPVPEALCLAQVGRYECSADLQPLPANGLLLWTEAGRLAVAFTREGRAVHLQSFTGSVVTPEIAIELLCTKLTLETEEVLARLETVELRGDFSWEEHQLLAGMLGVQTVSSQPVAPVLPAKSSGLLPSLVAGKRKKVRDRQRLERVLIGVAAVYVLFVLVFLLNVAWLSFQTNHLRQQIAANRPTVELIHATSQRWHALESAITPTIYPLEVLFQSSGLLPADGVRFTLFEQHDNHVIIRGEANDAAAAFKLVEDIKGKSELNYFDWEMPRPNILPNDKAEFQIEGTPPDAPAN